MRSSKTATNFGDLASQLWTNTGNKCKVLAPILWLLLLTPWSVQRKPQILVWILPDKNAVSYERLKRNMECRYGIVSQSKLLPELCTQKLTRELVLQGAHVRNAQPQYCSNVSMKINAKLGGSTSRVAIEKIGGPSEFFSRYNTMVIGADVSHPSPGSPQGSTAALTMSMDKHAARYAAAVQTNGHRYFPFPSNLYLANGSQGRGDHDG